MKYTEQVTRVVFYLIIVLTIVSDIYHGKEPQSFGDFDLRK